MEAHIFRRGVSNGPRLKRREGEGGARVVSKKGNRMQYAILVYESESELAARIDPERSPTYWAAYRAYTQALLEAGISRGGAGLESPSDAATVRFRGTERVIQDGLSTDAEERLGGFYVIEVDNLDDALDWAGRCPSASTGCVEVRPTLPPPPAP